MPLELWDALPPKLSRPLAALQHAGAAVLTGFERVAEMSPPLPDLVEELLDPADTPISPHEEVTAKLMDHQRKASMEDGKKEEEVYHCAPYRRDSGATGTFPFPSLTSRSSSFMASSSSAFSSGSVTRSNSTSHPSPNSMEILTPETPPVSPLVLPPSFDNSDFRQVTSPLVEGGIGGIASPRLATSKFVQHSDPRTAQFLAELHHLRHEMLVRLRHSVLRVDAEWRDCRRTSSSGWGESGFENGGVLLPSDLDGDFEAWWKAKKIFVGELEHKAKTIGRGMKVSIGWGGDGGTGWAA